MAQDKPLMVLLPSFLSQKLNEIEQTAPNILSLPKTLFHPIPKAIWTFLLSQHFERPGVKQGKLPFEELLYPPPPPLSLIQLRVHAWPSIHFVAI